MPAFKFAIVACWVSACASLIPDNQRVDHHHKHWRGRHLFPDKDHRGREAANELQFIEPYNIVDVTQETEEYEITDVSPLFIDNDDEVVVSFSASIPDRSDWIAVYSPADVDITSTVPVKYAWCDEDPAYLVNGTGSLTFNMTNLRADFKFYYFTDYTWYPKLVANGSQVVNFNNINEQLRPRVQATGDYNVLNISWSSNMSTQPVLKWGTQPGVYSHTAEGFTERVLRSDMCNAPASTVGWRDLGEIHTASLVGAAALANTVVYYTVGDEATDTWSREGTLHLPPLPGTQPPDRPTTVVLFDDLGRGSTDESYTWNEYGRPSVFTTMAVSAEINNGLVDAIYHGGDISYATGYMAVWDFFLDMLSPMSGSVVYLTTVGNHESDAPNSESYYQGNDSGGECGVATTTLLKMPAPATTNRPWWSYDIGLIHFVGISTEHNYTIGSPQYLWLENDLANVDRSVTPWIIFGGHRAMYINSNYGGAATSDIVVMEKMIANLEHLLFKYRVNIGFYGHNHAVQRMSAVYDSKVVQAATPKVDGDGNEVAWHEDPQATVHMVIGTGGAKFTKNFVEPYPKWCEKVFYQYGYAKVSAVNSTYLYWEWIDASDNLVYDRMVITQNTNFSEAWAFSASGSAEVDDDDSAIDGILIAFIIVGCIFFVVVVGLFAYRVVRSDTALFGTHNGNGITLSALHEGSENHMLEEAAGPL